MKKTRNINQNYHRLKTAVMVMVMWLSGQALMAQDAVQPKRTGEVQKISMEQLQNQQAKPQEQSVQKAQPAAAVSQQQTPAKSLNFKKVEINEVKKPAVKSTNATASKSPSVATPTQTVSKAVKKDKYENKEVQQEQPTAPLE